ncbi:type II toxin-antitoxin system RelE/ParE family toxin [Marinobacterium sp. LSUCC0821]|jgi:hypothetical protein|uniref:type II toxin-antitoxin system RelE/ParE family toxin n=1 Tax=Marinobacterium sp. LSUCC0821 TaxID=2668067 RepID=UPI001451AF86|nr:type II toxin-antitoxin system RelE/ParE family toxin [Marinobacterium sp. LSUCC0821]QJD71952.1 type II toxin-antitoxin system RelE/ParE family toxin [Marinobacterium sp. LSUCC0821]
MIRAIEFIETTLFTKQFREIATDEDLRNLQEELIANPYAGALIVGAGGVRKIRIPKQNRGKSGGSRVIYFLATSDLIYLLLAYPKSHKETLTDKEKSALRTLTRSFQGESE